MLAVAATVAVMRLEYPRAIVALNDADAMTTRLYPRTIDDTTLTLPTMNLCNPRSEPADTVSAAESVRARVSARADVALTPEKAEITT